jgi:hypothetical protein
MTEAEPEGTKNRTGENKKRPFLYRNGLFKRDILSICANSVTE